MKLELFSASDIMAYPVVTFDLVESVPHIAQTLLDTGHHGFPVVVDGTVDCPHDGQVFHGLITRLNFICLFPL